MFGLMFCLIERALISSRCGGMADAADLYNLSVSVGNSGMDGVKVGESFFEIYFQQDLSQNGNTELRPKLNFGKV